eukprot:5819180-Amphidinium_carterae.1
MLSKTNIGPYGATAKRNPRSTNSKSFFSANGRPFLTSMSAEFVSVFSVLASACPCACACARTCACVGVTWPAMRAHCGVGHGYLPAPGIPFGLGRTSN